MINLLEKTKYQVTYSNEFKKNYKKLLKQGKNIDKLKIVVNKLANKETLDWQYRDHALNNSKKFKGCRDCHIEPDWILVYKYEDDELILLLLNTGSHSEIFNM